VTLTAYLDQLSAPAGSTIDCMVSSDAPEVRLEVIRLIHGDTNPAGPGARSEPVGEIPAVTVPGVERTIHLGSCVVVPRVGTHPLAGLDLEVTFSPTLAGNGRRQGIVSLLDDGDRPVLTLALGGDGALLVEDGGPSADPVSALRVDWTRGAWYRARLTVDGHGGVTLECRTFGFPHDRVVATARATGATGPQELFASVVVGAVTCARPGGQWHPVDSFNGKIENPVIRRTDDTGRSETVADWRFERSPSSDRCEDASVNGRHGVVVNAPARAATGARWTGHETDFTKAPEQYGAIHFHDDDLDDAAWPVSATFDLPTTLPSGVYGVRLTAGSEEDVVPFAVRPAEGGPHARTVVLLPTFTYIAYGNERMIDRLDFEGDSLTDHPVVPGFHDRQLARHPEWGLSLYDVHSDGSTCVHSTHRRPIPNLRPDYRAWLQDAPRHLSADLYLVDWLTEQGRAFDVITDHDLNAHGAALLEPHDLVITGSHPEYVSERMLDALEAHTSSGGALMYLGGNGFYWVTSQDPERPHLIEVRRGPVGTRPSEGAPGEGTHSTTGEPGGLWRQRGRWPNRLTGIGMTAQGWDQKAPGYARMPDSRRPEVAFAFAGIGDDEIIGDFGLIMDGSAGDEIDRYDTGRGSPENAYVLARSTGHSDYYQLAGEDVLASRSGLGGTECPDVRSDIVLFSTPGGGSVFSAGSICFTGALSHNGYRNNVSTLIGNVMDEFLREPGRKQAP